MRFKSAFVLVAFLALLAAPAAAADLASYKLDPPHSSVGFAVRHLAVSTVRGEFTDFTGTFQVDEADPTKSSFEVHIQAASINTRNDRRDNHLRSADFFDAANNPELVFKSKRIVKSGDEYVAYGDLTIRGVTKEVPLRFTLIGPVKDPGKLSRIGVEAHATVNRMDYGVSWSRALEGGGFVVSDDVRIEINAELVKVDPATGQPIRLE